MLGHEAIATILLVISLIGIMHAMNHHTFYQLSMRLLNDANMLVKSIVDYLSIAFPQLGIGRKNDGRKLIEIVEHYDVMMSNARPLVQLFVADLRNLFNFFNNLESIRLIEKLIYSYFRQSAINIIDHLKRVYELY